MAIHVYIDNGNQTESIPIIGDDNNLTCNSLRISGLVSIVSYVIDLTHKVGVYDDIDH